MSKLLIQKDLFEYLQVTRQTIYHWRRKGIFPKPYQIGKFLCWKQEDIDPFVNQHTARISVTRYAAASKHRHSYRPVRNTFILFFAVQPQSFSVEYSVK